MEFEAFMTANLDKLGRYAGVLTGDRQVAQDVLSQALIAVWRKWDRIGRVEFPLAYIRATITTTYLDQCRRDARRRTFPTASDAALDSAVSPVTDQVDDRSELDELLSGLPARQRAVLVMRFYLDLPDASIAVVLGCSASTVRSAAFRGLAALRAHPLTVKDRRS